MRRRQQFMDAGLELFGTIGYRAATVRALCRQAGYTDRYFYESFSGMEDLLEAVYHRCVGRIQQRLLATVVGANPLTDPRALVRASLEAFFEEVEDTRLARVCWLELLGVSPRIDQVYNAVLKSFAELIFRVTRSIYPHWSMGDDEAQVLTIALTGAVSESAVAWLLSDYRASRKTMVSATCFLFHGLIAAIESEQLPKRRRPSSARASAVNPDAP